MIQPPSHLPAATGLTSPKICRLQPSLCLVFLSQTRRPQSFPPQSVISTAPRPVWSYQIPSGSAADAGPTPSIAPAKAVTLSVLARLLIIAVSSELDDSRHFPTNCSALWRFRDRNAQRVSGGPS